MQQGPAVPAARAHRPGCAFRAAQGLAQLLCLQRLDQARCAGASLFDEAGASANSRRSPAGRSTPKDGIVSDLATPPRSEVWDEVAAEPDLCGRLKCPHYDKCFLFKAAQGGAWPTWSS